MSVRLRSVEVPCFCVISLFIDVGLGYWYNCPLNKICRLQTSNRLDSDELGCNRSYRSQGCICVISWSLTYTMQWTRTRRKLLWFIPHATESGAGSRLLAMLLPYLSSMRNQQQHGRPWSICKHTNQSENPHMVHYHLIISYICFFCVDLPINEGVYVALVFIFTVQGGIQFWHSLWSAFIALVLSLIAVCMSFIFKSKTLFNMHSSHVDVDIIGPVLWPGIYRYVK